MTERQQAYLDFVQHCKNNECKLKFASDNEEASMEADPTTDPRCKLKKKNWRPKFCDVSKHPSCKKSSNPPKFCQQSDSKGSKNRGKRTLRETSMNNITMLLLNPNMDSRRSKRQATNKPAVRKDYRALTDQERDVIHYAMNRLKKETVDKTNKWDLFTAFHYPQQAPSAHWGPGFLPWHREFLRQCSEPFVFF